MLGLAVLVIVLAYVGLARAAIKRLPSKKAKYIGLAVAVLIPTWDIVPGYFYFHYLCQNEAGERIYKTAENVVGVYQEDIVQDNATLLRGAQPYKYVELLRNDIPDTSQKLARTTLDASGAFQTVMLPVDQRQSQYSLGRLPVAQPYSNLFHILIVEYTIADMQTNEVMAKHTAFKYAGGWFSRFLSIFSGTGHPNYDRCPSGYYGGQKFIFEVLKPSK